MEQELIQLIDAAITDGVISDQERQVILKQAIALDEDPDVVNVYIDAALQKANMKQMAATRYGKEKTCPYCGASVPQLTDKCPYCGGFITVEASTELKKLIESLESAIAKMKSESGSDSFKGAKAEAEKHLQKLKVYYKNNPRVAKLIEETDAELNQWQMKHKKSVRMTFIGVGVFILFMIFLSILGKFFSDFVKS